MEASAQPSKLLIDAFVGETENRPGKLVEPDVEEDVGTDGVSVPPYDQESEPLTSLQSGETPRRLLLSYYNRIPYLRKVPSFVTFPITILILINFTVWAIVGIVLRSHP
jgi:hypothetical protein